MYRLVPMQYTEQHNAYMESKQLSTEKEYLGNIQNLKINQCQQRHWLACSINLFYAQKKYIIV